MNVVELESRVHLCCVDLLFSGCAHVVWVNWWLGLAWLGLQEDFNAMSNDVPQILLKEITTSVCR